ncbi:MAG: SRPBCC domain-containing protein [Planctomycetes bacterium]|nr:SRPBCC domain-containing protein [Planctomycetota bacterium]
MTSPFDKTPPSQTEAIAFEFDLPHAPAVVWRALTEPELLAEWLLPAVGLDLAPGATFRFEAEPQPGWDGIVSCRVLEVDAPRRLSYAWVVGDMDTVVTFTLTETATGTHLALAHTGFRADQQRNFGGARYGWGMMGGKLVDLLGRIA